MAIIGLLLSTLLVFLYAIVAHFAWGWFVQPLGAPAISYAHALGLALLARFMVSSSTLADILLIINTDREELSAYNVARTGLQILAALIAWGIMAIVHSMM